MATIRRAWTENVVLHASSALAAGASQSDAIDLDALGADLVDLIVDVTFGASPDGDVTVEVLPSPDSGATLATVGRPTVIVPRVTGTQVIVPIKIQDAAHVTVKVTNNDTTDNVTYASQYSWSNWQSV